MHATINMMYAGLIMMGISLLWAIFFTSNNPYSKFTIVILWILTLGGSTIFMIGLIGDILS